MEYFSPCWTSPYKTYDDVKALFFWSAQQRPFDGIEFEGEK